MTLMLASVRSLDEAIVVLDGGADLIDLKEPARGALGALDHAAVRICVRAIDGRRPVSATIGDIPSMEPQLMVDAVERMAATGVDFIKIGFFSHPRAVECAEALSALASRSRLIAVLFADASYDLAMVQELSRNGFAGAMLDTAHKTGKTLCDWRTEHELSEFVSLCRSHGLIVGLAGSLCLENISRFAVMDPDYLGFRGALCRHGKRGGILDQDRIARIRAAIAMDDAANRRAAA